MARTGPDHVVLGYLAGLYGVGGWVRVFSYARPKANILCYSPWQLVVDDVWTETALVAGRIHGKGIIAKLAGCENRDQATRLLGAKIAVHRRQLPALEPGEYYWADLIGLDVVTSAGARLGEVARLLETGANDVLVVKGDREHLIPWVRGRFILDVDLVAGRIHVDWEPGF
ncbi:MAG: ribosome maturation factor RimM [Gammaproteobacteria bacterium]|nr:ribosome maturation factor RimM [Gammaproteobacteria bacterium]MCI0590209.1 ribosome maturation factor RimM [Gammaproteobacteria bacterium]